MIFPVQIMHHSCSFKSFSRLVVTKNQSFLHPSFYVLKNTEVDQIKFHFSLIMSFFIFSTNPDQLQEVTFGPHLEFPDGSVPSKIYTFQ